MPARANQPQHSTSGKPATPRKPARAAGETRTIWKRCLGCDQYFAGELNGEYRCPACQAQGVEIRHALSSLGPVDELVPSAGLRRIA